MVIMMAVDTTPTRQIIRDAVAGQIIPNGVSVAFVGEYTLKIVKNPSPKQCKFIELSELRNYPTYILDFDEAEIVLKVERATSSRMLAKLGCVRSSR